MKIEPREITPTGWCIGCPNYGALRDAFINNPDESTTPERCKECQNEYIARER